MRRKITKKNLIEIARNASSKAIERTRLAGGAITFQRGKKIIKEYSDGHQEVIGTLAKAYVKAKKKRYKIIHHSEEVGKRPFLV